MYKFFVCVRALTEDCQCDISEGDKEKFKLCRAFEEMTRLDEILYRVTCKEKETKRQRRELQARLWEDLQVYPDP